MWVALCLTFSFSTPTEPVLDLKVGYGRYRQIPHVHLKLDRTRVLEARIMPLGALRPRRLTSQAA